MSKSTITISDDGKQILFEVKHDPPLSGTRDTWHIPGQTADGLVRWLLSKGKDRGLEPTLEIHKNTVTGNVDITTRHWWCAT